MSDMIQLVEWRLLIGPSFSDYDWSVHNTGAEDALSPSTSLALDLNETATAEMVVANATSFPNDGGLWVGPNGNGENWEYIGYSGKLSASFYALLRENNASYHTAGAVVQQFQEVRTNDGAWTFEWELDDDMQLTSWTVNVQGVAAPPWIFRRHHVAIIQTKTAPTSNWANLFVGFTDSPTVEDNADSMSPWTLQIISSTNLAEQYDIESFRVGEVDLFKAGTADAQSELAAPWKERSKGDFTKAFPDLDADSAIDGDDNTLWISEVMVGRENYMPLNGDPTWGQDSHIMISGMLLTRPEGYDARGFRWIELTIVPPRTGAENSGAPPLQICNENAFYSREILFETMTAVEKSEARKIVLIENKELYLQENPFYTGHLEILDQQFFDGTKPEGDTIALLIRGEYVDWAHGVSWGSGDGIAKFGSVLGGNYYEWSLPVGQAKLPAPSPGVSFHYTFYSVVSPWDGTSTTVNDYWRVNYESSPGYTIGAYPYMEIGDDGILDEEPGYNQGKLRKPWIMASSPSIGLALRDDITAASPGNGDDLYVFDGSNEPSVAGLDIPCTIQIAEEQIYCTNLRREDGALIVATRGANGTSSAAHAAGDSIQVVENSIATDAIPLREIGWRRRDGGFFPTNFEIWGTRRVLVRQPDAWEWTNDWEHITTITGHPVSQYTMTLDPPQRLRHLALIISGMNGDPVRPRINEIFGLVDEGAYEDSRWITDPTPAGETLRIFLERMNMPTGAITVLPNTQILDGISTQPTNQKAMLGDMADFSQISVTCGLDSKIVIQPNEFWTETLTPTRAWSRDELASIKQIKQTKGTAVGQVQMLWRDEANSEDMKSYYPVIANPGAIQTFGPYIIPDEATASLTAQRRYEITQYPWITICELALPDLSLVPGEVVTIDWDLLSGELIESTAIMLNVSHEIDEGTIKTFAQLTEVTRSV